MMRAAALRADAATPGHRRRRERTPAVRRRHLPAAAMRRRMPAARATFIIFAPQSWMH
ncbi:hypothetical protein [Burkholderia stagnalis]|uniref:hypothetical protein n=1 Tax=Burkholderia stagnalis TaxID=1503054 RepID=UPI000AA33936|nr:hypothetical protein [Burkholderia stagnalis]MDY7806373.1 hypothetical protein [Burkholderia stagnalis]